MSKSGRKHTPRSTEAEVESRVSQVLGLLVSGAGFMEIQHYSAQKGWNLSDRPLKEYMSRATNLLAEHEEEDRKLLVALHQARRNRLYALALQAHEYRTALEILKDSAEMEGLYPPKGITAEIGVTRRGAPMSDEELDTILNGQQP